MDNYHLYTLLVGVGNYREMELSNLPAYRADLDLIGGAISDGLKSPGDHIRFLAGPDDNGTVRTRDFARAFAGFRSLLTAEDTFIFYFSGHGIDQSLIFSDGQIELQSVINITERLPARNKLVILDCCHAGAFKTKGARRLDFEEAAADFAGHGIAVMASTSADGAARLDRDGRHSLFTGALAAAMTTNRTVRKGLVDLHDIIAQTRRLVEIWNRQNPGKEQTPVFRTSLGGTIYFPVEEYKPYEQMTFRADYEKYAIDRVEPRSSMQEKRLCAFVILKGQYAKTEIARISAEIAENIKYAQIYAGEKSEARFKGKPASVVWCYFGYDQTDMAGHLHAMYSVWAAPSVRVRYFRKDRHAELVDGIYIRENPDYFLLKGKQHPGLSREDFILQNRKFLSLFVNMAGQFITDLEAVGNKELSMEEMQEKYWGWIRQVRAGYIDLTDLDIPPDDLHDWADEILNLAGCILDVSVLMEGERDTGQVGERERFLITDAIRKYNESLMNVVRLEKDIDF